MAQNTVRLDEGEEEESEVTQRTGAKRKRHEDRS